MSCLLFLLIVTSVGMAGYSVADAQDTFRVTKEMQITADIADLPLGQTLAVLSQNVPLEIRGGVAADERLTVRFSQLTLQQALREMMAGYNYVLIRPGEQGALVLVILGKAERTSSALSSLPEAPPAQSVALPPSPSEAPPPSLTGPAPTAHDGTMAPTSSATAAPLLPVPPSPTTPAPAGQASAVQTATTGQMNPFPGLSMQETAGSTLNQDSQPEFNPAAWGGRGRRGSATSGRK